MDSVLAKTKTAHYQWSHFPELSQALPPKNPEQQKQYHQPAKVQVDLTLSTTTKKTQVDPKPRKNH